MGENSSTHPFVASCHQSLSTIEHSTFPSFRSVPYRHVSLFGFIISAFHRCPLFPSRPYPQDPHQSGYVIASHLPVRTCFIPSLRGVPVLTGQAISLRPGRSPILPGAHRCSPNPVCRTQHVADTPSTQFQKHRSMSVGLTRPPPWRSNKGLP